MSVPGLAVPCPPQLCPLSGLGGHLAQGAATAAASSVLTVLAGLVVGGATWLIQHTVGLLTADTSVNLAAAWFQGREAAMVRIAALVVGPLLAAATIGAVIRQDGRRLARIFGVGLPVAVLGTATAIAMTQLAVTVVNSLCTLITPPGAYEPFVQLGGAIGRPGIPIFVQFVLASLVVLAAIVLWMEMVLRGAVLFIAVFFLPFGLAAFIWPATAHITKRFVEIIVAVVGSKFVIVATLSLGGAFVGNNHAGIDGAVTGTAILLLAAFAPFSVLRLVPIVEASATSHLEGLSRRPAHAATSAAGAVSSAGRGAGVLGSLGARTGSAASGVMAFDVGQQQGSWAVPSSSAEASGTGVAAVASRLPASTGAPSGGGSAAPPTGDHGGAEPLAPPVPAPPPEVRSGSAGPDPDGWSDDA